MGVEVAVLGRVRVFVGGEPVEISRPQVRHLLGLLVAAEGWVSVDALIEDLWRSRPPKAARSSLQLVVKRLRDALGDDQHEVVLHGSAGYRLDGALVSTDLARWREGVGDTGVTVQAASTPAVDMLSQMRSLRELWRGGAFADVEDSPMLDVTRRALDSQRIEMELREARLLVETGQPGLAVVILERTLVHDPLDERTAVQLVESLVAVGRRNEALGVVAETRKRFREQLGVSPSAALRSAENRALQPQALDLAVSKDSGGPEQLAWRPSLVKEIADELVLAARGDQVNHLQLTAPPQFGRTSVLNGVASNCTARGVRAVVNMRRHGQIHSLRKLIPPNLLELAASEQAEYAIAARQVFGGRPTVLLVDDVEHLDRWSLRFLVYLESATLGVAVVGVSDAFEGPELPRPHREFRLEPLNAAEVHTLVSATLSSASEQQASERADRLTLWSGGHPRALNEGLGLFARDLDAPLPPRSLDHDDRLQNRHVSASVSAPEASLLALAHCLGSPTKVELLRALANDGEFDMNIRALIGRGDLVFDAIDDAVRLTSSASTPPGIRFDSSEHARVLGEGAKVLRRMSDVKGAAQLLCGTDGSSVPGIAPDIARDWLIEGADLFEADGAYGAAAEALRRAAALDSSNSADRLLLRAAHAAEWSGDTAVAEETYRTLVDRNATLETPDLEVLATAGLAGGGHSGGSIGGQEGRRARLTLARRRVPPEHPASDLLLTELAYERWAARQPIDRATRSALERVASDNNSPAHLLAWRLVAALSETLQPVSLEDARRMGTTAMSSAHAPDSTAAERAASAKCLVVAASIAMSSGDLPEAEALTSEIEIIGSRTGMPQARWQSLAMKAALLDCRGRAADADRAAAQARRLGTALNISDATPTYFVHHLGRAFRGNSLAAVAGPIGQTAERFRFPVWFALRGLASLDSGDERSAHEALDRAVEVDGGDADYFRIQAIALSVLLAARLDRSAVLKRIRSHLDPFEGRLLFFGYGGAFLAPIDWFRAHGERVLGSTTVAERLARSSADAASRAGALGWLDDPVRTARFEN